MSDKMFPFLLLGILLSLFPLTAQSQAAPSDTTTRSCPLVRIEVERLPDMNIPRCGHTPFMLNGELTVIGGHTSGFVPTATAEYFKDGQWHLMDMVYSHDDGLILPLSSGKVLVAGGHEQHLGIGQTFPVEMYDPVNHTFEGMGCLHQKRALFSGVEIDSGRVMIAGNWYHDDGIESFDGEKNFIHVKEVALQRAFPYLLRTASDDVLIFGPIGIHGEDIDAAVADRLHGDTIHIPLFEEWKPTYRYFPIPSIVSAIGNGKDDFSYLLNVRNKEGQTAIALMRGTDASLLPTVCPIPMSSPQGGITYISPVIIDRKAQRGYVVGISDNFDTEKSVRLYILCVEYGPALKGEPAPLTLYDAGPGFHHVLTLPVLNADGDLVLTGGLNDFDNFKPSAEVLLLRTGNHTATAVSKQHRNMWKWLIAALLLLLAALGVMGWMRTRRKRDAERKLRKEEDLHPIEVPVATSPSVDEGMSDMDDNAQQLMQRLCTLMEEEMLFKRCDLKLSDIASLLGVSSRSISDCIKTLRGCSFPYFVNSYRIEHAKKLMSQSPQKKTAEVWTEAGFANETSFFRTFKTFTGMTPKEWIHQST